MAGLGGREHVVGLGQVLVLVANPMNCKEIVTELVDYALDLRQASSSASAIDALGRVAIQVSLRPQRRLNSVRPHTIAAVRSRGPLDDGARFLLR